ncbi:hypothetical protein AB0J42_20160 [Nonomuraea sp. NPDC049649]|uniref:hypothetical protein n=1 Tax=Nonomuraea sp. NPDC049649 TaxID=3155776 RepID=UPI003415DAA2
MWKRVAPALGLFFLSPLVGEFLLGNLPITMLFALITLAPLYGGGALLVRELARRRGAGWPGIVLLAVAYGLIEEGLVTRSLFNPGYAGMDLQSYLWIPGVGVSAWWTVFVLGVHVVGSICVPIAVMESLVPGRATEPWLRTPGLVVAGVLFMLGAAAAYTIDPYEPGAWQLVGAALLAGLLVFIALKRRPATSSAVAGQTAEREHPAVLAETRPAAQPEQPAVHGGTGPAAQPEQPAERGGTGPTAQPEHAEAGPTPERGRSAERAGAGLADKSGRSAERVPGGWAVLVFSLVAGAVFWLSVMFLDALGGWLVMVMHLALYVTVCVLVVRWAREPGWGLWQRFALAAGGVVTYAWHGFPQPPAIPADPAVDLAGNVVFAVAAIALLALAARKIRSYTPAAAR